MVNLLSINIREESERAMALQKEYETNRNLKGVLVKTCQRVELYHGEGTVPDDVARHLFRLTSGLNSIYLGECAIQGQVKNAYLEAANTRTLGTGVNKLFQRALFVGKKVRSQTGISEGAMSHSQATVMLINQKYGSITGKNITILGVHNMSEHILQFLQRKKAETVLVGNRNFEKAAQLAGKYGYQAFNFDSLTSILATTDILISCTSAPHHVVDVRNFPSGKPMFIIDLAVPADVDPILAHEPGIELNTISNVENVIIHSQKNRQNEILSAEQIIEDELLQFIISFTRYAKN